MASMETGINDTPMESKKHTTAPLATIGCKTSYWRGSDVEQGRGSKAEHANPDSHKEKKCKAAQ